MFEFWASLETNASFGVISFNLTNRVSINYNNYNNFIMIRIFTISTEIDIRIKLKMLDNSNSANPQVA